MSLSYEGPSQIEEKEFIPFDMHCPQCGSQPLNFMKAWCEQKQRDPNIRECYMGCKSVIKNEEKPNILTYAVCSLFNRGYSYTDIAKGLRIGTSTIAKHKKIGEAEGILD